MLTRWVAAAGRAIARHGGTTEQAAGDVVLAVFGFPVLNEDDPLRAVLTAAALRDVAASLDEELERDFGVCLAVRIGVHTGEVVTRDPSAGQAQVRGP